MPFKIMPNSVASFQETKLTVRTADIISASHLLKHSENIRLTEYLPSNYDMISINYCMFKF